MISQSEIKYNRMMEKAKELFFEFGYRATSMDQIAEESGISKMTIYRYFSSKEELFIKVVLSVMDEYFRYIMENISKMEGTLEKIDFLLNFALEHSKVYSLAFYKDLIDNPYIYDELFREKKKMSRIILEDIIEEGMKRGEIRDIDEVFIADMLIALIDGVDKDIFININSKDDIQSFTEKFYDFLKYGLLGK